MTQKSLEELNLLEHNPVLSPEELEAFRAFFKLFENEFGLASISKMLSSLEPLNELNTGVICKILAWAKTKSDSNC